MSSAGGSHLVYKLSKIVVIYAQSIPSPPGKCRAFVILSVQAVGNLSVLLEAVNIVSFSIFHLKIRLFSWL